MFLLPLTDRKLFEPPPVSVSVSFDAKDFNGLKDGKLMFGTPEELLFGTSSTVMSNKI
jgi:hypothetical protein